MRVVIGNMMLVLLVLACAAGVVYGMWQTYKRDRVAVLLVGVAVTYVLIAVWLVAGAK